jgi:hypothetical protein
MKSQAVFFKTLTPIYLIANLAFSIAKLKPKNYSGILSATDIKIYVGGSLPAGRRLWRKMLIAKCSIGVINAGTNKIFPLF